MSGIAPFLLLSAAVQVSQHIIPQAYLPSLDRYYVMDYDLEYYNSAPYSDAVSYLETEYLGTPDRLIRSGYYARRCRPRPLP